MKLSKPYNLKLRSKIGVFGIALCVLLITINSAYANTVTITDLAISDDSGLLINFTEDSSQFTRVSIGGVNITDDGISDNVFGEMINFTSGWSSFTNGSFGGVREINGSYDNKDTFISNSKGNYWEVDGTADDVQIQLAIDNITTHGTVWVGSDVSLDSELSLTNNNCDVDFQGHKVTLSSDITFINVTSCRHSSVSNVKVQITDGHTAPILLLYFPDNGLWADRIRYCDFNNIEIYNPSAGNAAHNYTGIHLFIDSDNDNPADLGNIFDNSFYNIYIDGCYNGILLECGNTDAYGNGNHFEDVYFNQYVVGVNFSVHAGATTGYDQNVFEKIEAQSATFTKYGIKSIQGQGNAFENILFWDWYACDSPIYEIEVSSAAEDTILNLHYLYNDGSGVDYIDNGADTQLNVMGTLTGIDHINRWQTNNLRLFRGTDGHPEIYIYSNDSGTEREAYMGMVDGGHFEIGHSNGSANIRFRDDGLGLYLNYGQNTIPIYSMFNDEGTSWERFYQYGCNDSGVGHHYLATAWDGTNHRGNIKTDYGSIYLDPANSNVTVAGDIYCTGKLTSVGGNDPPYVLYNKETFFDIVKRINDEVPKGENHKWDGQAIYYDGDEDNMFLYNPKSGDTREFVWKSDFDVLEQRITELEAMMVILMDG